jgi:CRP/FNR family transcriptional regulator, cyclic AMP receptor protein
VATERKLVRVLSADPDLGAGLDDETRALAERYAVAESLRMAPGPWDPHRDGAGRPGDLGLLVLSGLLKRRVEVADSACAELLGQGDVLRPWQEDEGWDGARVSADWEAIEPVWVAVLDRRFAVTAGRWPELIDALMGRGIRRSRQLAFHMALSHLTRVDVRLLALFWHLADRWGRVSPEGVVVPLRLTHQTLASLIGAQRPSVTTALGGLAQAGQVTRRAEGGWLLHGGAPEDPRSAGTPEPLSEAG